jgi:hypothetical protein
MKKIFLFLMLVIFVWACSDNPSGKVKKENLEKAKQELAKMGKFPKMEFEYTEVDFGQHKEGEILDTIFVFTNTGDAPLIISKVRSSCGCTIPDWPKEPVKPGQKDTIKVSFNTNHKTGNQRKKIDIHSNEKQLVRTLIIRAQIEPKKKKNDKNGGKVLKLPKISPFDKRNP